MLLDVPQLEEQMLGLVWRDGKIDHPSGEHDDWANAAAGAVVSVSQAASVGRLDPRIMALNAVAQTPTAGAHETFYGTADESPSLGRAAFESSGEVFDLGRRAFGG